ncbi:MAG: SusC/RagA family protein, partial [Bacteroidales bacterium]|nr:SusC/RagA family protein [Bacteroidales bacterium]
VAKANNSVKSLGGVQETLITLSDDAQLITRVGEDPYAFYGYETNGVFATTDEAVAANMKNLNGLTYSAGDVRYVDQNNDGYINEEDRVILGSASPDLLGGVFNRFQYKQFALDVNLAFSIGNEAYNAVRRSMESSSDFSNQSRAVNRRWTMEGQITDMPKASWGDVIGNNDFSDRWIEDASYVKLRDVTLSYSFNKPVWNFFQSGVLFVTGENLLTFTNYLGMDPEFSYSYSDALQGIDYAKVALPKTVKVGVNLKF